MYHVGNSPHIKQPKSDAGCRDVPLLPALAQLLPKKLGKGYLFAEPDGSLLTNDHFTALYDAYRDASGVTVTPHQIRHGYATALLESGVDPKTAQVLLGHAQLSTTMDIYTHVRDGQLKAAAERWKGLLNTYFRLNTLLNTETSKPLKTAGKNRVQIPPSAPNEKPLELLAMLAISTVFRCF